MKRKKKLEKKKCKIENVNNFSLRLKIEMIILIISHQMYYTDFYYISSNGNIEHKFNGGLYPELYSLSKKNSLHIVYEFRSLW